MHILNNAENITNLKFYRINITLYSNILLVAEHLVINIKIFREKNLINQKR